MRAGITVEVNSADRARLQAIVADRNSRQKHVWRARIVLMTADGVGTNTIMRQTGKSKVTVWRWQERFMAQGVDGLLRDKTRPSRIPRLPATVHEQTVALTQTDPPGEVTHNAERRIMPHDRRRNRRLCPCRSVSARHNLAGLPRKVDGRSWLGRHAAAS